ncbi:MAG: STAS domain-containing protein [Methylococcaceae bacterium]
MSKLNIISEGIGQFVVDGDLTFSTIDKNTVKSFAFLNSAKEIVIDLSRVSCTDSAGLALMIEWIKYTRSKRIHLSFKNIPEQLLTLAKLSGFDKSNYFAIQVDHP